MKFNTPLIWHLMDLEMGAQTDASCSTTLQARLENALWSDIFLGGNPQEQLDLALGLENDL